MKGFFLSLLFVLSTLSSLAQDPVIFRFGNHDVKKSEFEFVYKKNNQNDPDIYTQKSVEEYLDLYINFRLKVKEAESLGLDTLQELMSELSTYRKQLARSYLFDREVNEKLIQEAYERMQKELNASHILVKIDGAGIPDDTLKAYKEALKIRNKILQGDPFEKLAKEFSADPSAKDNGGNIGWFTVFNTIYPFESVAYRLKKGEISMPVRTEFGYHIVRLNDARNAQGEINVAHILIRYPQAVTPEARTEAKKKIDDIYSRLKQGEDFEKLAADLSEDKFSAKKGGVLPPFGTGKMVESFEKTAFALANDGDISEPVESEVGWHIIKRISKAPLKTFQELQPELKQKVQKDSRSQVAQSALVNKIKKQYNFQEYPAALKELSNRIGSTLTEGRFTMADKSNLGKPVFKIADSLLTQLDFVKFLEEKQKKKRTEPADKIFKDYYKNYVDQTCLYYKESRLEKDSLNFRKLMQEYRDGILLFELTEDMVWSKAVKDTVGLKSFYETVKNKYLSEEKIVMTTYSSNDQKLLTKVQASVASGKLAPENVMAKYNKPGKPAVIEMSSESYFKGENSMADKLEWKKQVTNVEPSEDGVFQFIVVDNILPPAPKPLNEVKGYVVSDYQEKLEKEWIASLRAKYPVSIDQIVVKSIIRK